MKLTKILGLAAVGALLMIAAPTERAQAMSLGSPGASAAVQDGSRGVATEVGWHRRVWHRRMWRRHHW